MDIQTFRSHAMATWWEIRIAGEAPDYAAQAAQAAFQVTARMESLLSRFVENSGISAIATLPPGGQAKLSPDVCDCLVLSRQIEILTRGAFSLGATSASQGRELPRWEIDAQTRMFTAIDGGCELDPGAVGKGFSLDRMAEELALWGVRSFLLVSGGSSVLAGDPPGDAKGWVVALSGAGHDMTLHRQAMGASGFTEKGSHITDPRTGLPSNRYTRTWAVAPDAATADALSTAWMNMSPDEIAALCLGNPSLGAAILPPGRSLQMFGKMFCQY